MTTQTTDPISQGLAARGPDGGGGGGGAASNADQANFAGAGAWKERIRDYLFDALNQGVISPNEERQLQSYYARLGTEDKAKEEYQALTQSQGATLGGRGLGLENALALSQPEARVPTAAQRVADYSGRLADTYALTFTEQAAVRTYLDKAIAGYQRDEAQQRLNEVLQSPDLEGTLQQAVRDTARQGFRDNWGQITGAITMERDQAISTYERERWNIMLENLRLLQPAQESNYLRWYTQQLQQAAGMSQEQLAQTGAAGARPSDAILGVKLSGAASWLNAQAVPLIASAASNDMGAAQMRAQATGTAQQTIGQLLSMAQENVRSASAVYDLVSKSASDLRNAANSGRYGSDHAAAMRDMSDALRAKANTLAEGYVTGGGAASGLSPEDYVSQQSRGILRGSAGPLAGSLVDGDIFGSIQGALTPGVTPGDQARQRALDEQQENLRAAQTREAKLKGMLGNPLDKATGLPIWGQEQIAQAKQELQGLQSANPNAAPPIGSIADALPTGHISDAVKSAYAQYVRDWQGGQGHFQADPSKDPNFMTLQQFHTAVQHGTIGPWDPRTQEHLGSLQESQRITAVQTQIQSRYGGINSTGTIGTNTPPTPAPGGGRASPPTIGQGTPPAPSPAAPAPPATSGPAFTPEQTGAANAALDKGQLPPAKGQLPPAKGIVQPPSPPMPSPTLTAQTNPNQTTETVGVLNAPAAGEKQPEKESEKEVAAV